MKVYLDNNATTPLDERVLEAMLPVYRKHFGNPSSLHSFGRAAAECVDAAREKIARILGIDSGEIIFTASGSEADNLALKGVLEASDEKRPHIITSAIEHPAVYNTAEFLQERGVRVTFVPVGSHGIVDPDDIRRAINKHTVLVSIQHVNNEIGTIQPVKEIAGICAEKEIYFHTDAVQSVGRIPVDFGALGVDMASIAAHKFNGPKGVGLLFVRAGTRIRPVISGGSQEADRRAGTCNLPGIVGMADALGYAVDELSPTMQRAGRLRDRFEEAVLAQVSDISINAAAADRVPNTSSIAFKGIESEALLIKLDLEGIAASAGSACSTGSASASHVLMAMGLTQREAASSLRFSFGKFNTNEECDYAISVVPRAVARLREISARP